MSTIITEADLGHGLDGFHPETKLQSGFVPYTVNWLPSYNLSLVRRRGYQRVAGDLPIRVESITRSGTTLTLHLDSSLPLAVTPGTVVSPLTLFGRTLPLVVGNQTLGVLTPNAIPIQYAQYVITSANTIQVTGGPSTGATVSLVPGTPSNDTSLVGIDCWLWGIPSSALDPAGRSNWILNMSPYVAPDQSTLCISARRNLYVLSTDSTSYGMPSTTASIRASVTGTQVAGPAIFSVSPTTPPTRGYLESPASANGYLPIVSIGFDRNTGLTAYSLDATSLVVHGVLANIIQPGVDQLTVTQANWSSLDGTLPIVSVDSITDPSKLTIYTANTVNAAPDQQHDDLFNSGAQAGIFTCPITVSTNSIVSGDQLQIGSGLGEDYIALTSTPTQIVLDVVLSTLSISGVITGTRVSNLISVASSTGFVVGDVAVVGSYTRQFAVQSVGAGGGLLLDEIISVSDGDPITIPARWIIADSPDVPQKRGAPALSKPYVIPAGGTTDASFPNAALVGGSLYITNQLDPVQKFDGLSVYRAGLYRHNPIIGLDVHSNSPALINNPSPFVTATIDASGFTATCSSASDATQFTPGAPVVVSFHVSGFPDTAPEYINETTIVKAVNSTTSPYTLTFETALQVNNSTVQPGSPTFQIYQQTQLQYYTRWLCTDRNGHTSASPALASQDALVSLGPPAVVSMKLATYPPFDTSPFASISLQLYRDETVGAVQGTQFRLLTTIPVRSSFQDSFSPSLPTSAIARGFELYEDSNQLGSFGTGSEDPLLVLVSGANVGADWDGPPRSLCATSQNGSLILANIRGWPDMYLALRNSPAQVPSTFTVPLLHQSRFIFRRGGAEGDVADHVDIQAYEFIDQSQTTIYSNATIQGLSDSVPNVYVFKYSGSSVPASATVGSWFFSYFFIRLTQEEATQGLDFDGWFQVASAPSTDGSFVYIPFIFPERSRIVVPSSSVNPGTATFTANAPHGLQTGSPLLLVSNTDTAPTPSVIDRGIQLYAIVVTPTQFKVANSLATALTGTALTPSGTGTGTHQFVPHYAFASYSSPQNGLWNLIFADTPGDVPIPLYPNSTAANTSQFPGTYDVAEYERVTSVLLQLAIQQLTRAITAVQSATIELADVVTPTATPVFENAWLSADSGANYPFGTAYLRAPRPDAWTLEVRGTTDGSGSERFLLYAGDARIPNQAFTPNAVSTTTSSISIQNHGIQLGQKVRLFVQSGSTPPAPLTVDVVYYAVQVTENQFALSATQGGTPITLTTTGTGTISLTIEFAALEQLYPSRVLVSYPNYPEIFGGPFSASASPGDSVIDVNPDDGQPITAIIPFYSVSYTRASQQEARLVVFKAGAVYMVNTQTREVQAIQSLGHGAPLPRTVCETKDGISFSDGQGIYTIDRSNNWDYTGQVLGRLIGTQVSLSDVEPDIPVATNNPNESIFTLALPAVGDSTASMELTYDYTRENAGSLTTPASTGAWGFQRGIQTASYAIYEGLTYKGGLDGLVYIERTAGDPSDYRDDASPYTSTVLMRPMDFGAIGSRKQLKRVSVQFRYTGLVTETSLTASIAIDGQMQFLPMDSFSLSYTPPNTGLSDLSQMPMYTVQFTPPSMRAEYFQLQFSTDALDSPIEIVQIAYHVDLLTEHGVVQAADTTGTK